MTIIISELKGVIVCWRIWGLFFISCVSETYSIDIKIPKIMRRFMATRLFEMGKMTIERSSIPTSPFH